MDLGFVSFNAGETVVVIGGIFVFILQLIFCWNAKKISFKLLPTIITFVSATVFFVMIYVAEGMDLHGGWDVLGYLLLSLFSAFLFVLCLVAWILYAIFKKR